MSRLASFLDGATEAMLERACPVCGDTGSKPFVVAVPRTDAPERLARFARCTRCQCLVHDGPIAAFDQRFADDTGLALRKYVEDSAGLWEMFWPIGILRDARGRSLLDVGCGFGFTADLWRRHLNPDAHGCDPGHFAVAGRALLGNFIHPERLDESPDLNARRFDLIYASEVIEHVDDPRAFVRTLAERLDDDGVLVLTTPAAEFIDPRHDPATVVSALFPGFHAFLFTREALEGLLIETGFREVIVERHGERLLAWAARQPFERVSPTAILPLYLDYLDSRGATLPEDTEVARSVRAGLAFRRLKEHLLRGADERAREALPEARRWSMWVDGPGGDRPEPFTDALRACTGGPRAFGARFRFCLPQMAFLNALAAERLAADLPLARAWHAVARLATERLCAESVLDGVEAASFYWHSELRLLAEHIETADAPALAQGLAALVDALERPTLRIGGGSPPPTLVTGFLDRLLDADRSPEFGRFLEAVAAHWPGLKSLPARGAGRLTTALFRLKAAALKGGDTRTALAAAEKALTQLAERTGALADFLAGRIARERAQLAPASFATLAQRGWGATGYRTR